MSSSANLEFYEKPWLTELELKNILREQYNYQKEARINEIIEYAKENTGKPIYINRNTKKIFGGILKITYFADITPDFPIFIIANKRYSSIAQAQAHGF